MDKQVTEGHGRHDCRPCFFIAGVWYDDFLRPCCLLLLICRFDGKFCIKDLYHWIFLHNFVAVKKENVVMNALVSVVNLLSVVMLHVALSISAVAVVVDIIARWWRGSAVHRQCAHIEEALSWKHTYKKAFPPRTSNMAMAERFFFFGNVPSHASAAW